MKLFQAIGHALRGAKIRCPGMAAGEYAACHRRILMIHPPVGMPHQHMTKAWMDSQEWEVIPDGEV